MTYKDDVMRIVTDMEAALLKAHMRIVELESELAEAQRQLEAKKPTH